MFLGTKKKIDKKVNVLMGNTFLEKGKTEKAFEAFKSAGDKVGLMKLGNICLKNLQVSEAIKALKAAGSPVSKTLLIKLGYACLEKKGKEMSAVEAFKLADDEDGLNKCGHAYIEKGLLKEAVELFKEMDNKAELIRCGYICLKKKEILLATKAFEAAQYPPGLRKCGDKFLARGEESWSFETFGVPEELPKTSEQKKQNHNKENEMHWAVYAFKAARDKEGLTKCGHAYIEKGEMEKAREAFKNIALLEGRK